MGHTMKLFSRQARLFALILAIFFSANRIAAAQAGSVIPIPFATTIMGIAAGSSNTACTPDIPNWTGQHLGDGCLPTQASLLTIYDVQSDPAGNVYTSENGTNNDIRVVYKGGTAFGNMLKAANANAFTPLVGRIYTLAGGSASALTAVNKVYYCGNVTGGQQAQDSLGDGCPAAQSYIKPRGIAIDKYGNVYMTSNGGGDYIRVVYAGGTQVANLIALETPGTVPTVGYIYKIAGSTTTGYSGDGALASSAKFSQLRYIAVDGNGNIFASDGTTQSGTSPNIYEIAANNVREINGTTGIVSTFAGENTCVYNTTTGCPYGAPVEGSLAAGALLSTPYALFVDSSNNVYIADYYNSKIWVVYEGGTIAGVSNLQPIPNHIYTYAGGGTLTANGTLAKQVKFNQLYVAGIDNAGNVYAEDGTSKLIWRFDAATSTGNVIAAGPSTTTVAKAGVRCSGTTGPSSLDNYGDGCPALQANFSDTGHVAFDPQGNLYLAENGPGIVRELSYNNLFASSPTGASLTQPLAFESLVPATLSTESFALEGGSTGEYSDAGGDTCSLSGTLTAGTVCVFNISFTPSHAGQRPGSLQLVLSTSTAPSAMENLSGIGVASDLAIDAGTKSTIGTGLTPAGIATDLLGNVYVSDTTGNRVLKGASTGTSLTPLITGLNKPTGLAVDGFGNVYVADSGNNRVLETTSSGSTIGTVGTGLSAPTGVVVDGLGNIYIADTGNNRVLQAFTNGYQSVLPLTGISAPTELAIDAAGDLFILNSGSNTIIEYVAGFQSTLTLDSGVKPSGVAVDPAGDVYVTDSANQRIVAYPVGATAGNVLLTGITAPVELASDADANLFVADTGTAGAVELRRSLGSITFPLTNVPGQSTAGISVSNVGNATLSFPSSPLVTITGSTLYTVATSTTNGCALGTTYSPGAACSFTATFAPVITGSSTATAKFNTNAINTGTASTLLSGSGLVLVNTSTSLNVSPTPPAIYFGNAVTLTALLTPTTTTTTPTGTFTFTVNNVTQYPSSPVGSGSATLPLLNLAAGSDTASVTYSGDGTYASSAATVNFVVNQAITATALTVTPVNTAGSLSLTFKAVVSSQTATGETGVVTFYAGATAIGTVTLLASAGGIATLQPNPAVLSYSSNSFTAVYSGNTNFARSSSSVVVPISDFLLGYSSSTVSISAGGVGNMSFTVASLYGGSGTVTPSCTGMPSNSSCRFQPETLTIGATSQTESVLLYTNVLNTLATNKTPSSVRGIVFAFGLPLGIGLLLARRRAKLGPLAILLIGLTLSVGFVGCGTGSNASTANAGLVTPAGTYNINIVFTGSNGLTTMHSVPVTFTVIADSGAF